MGIPFRRDTLLFFSWLWLTGNKQRLTIYFVFGPLPLLPPIQHTEGEVTASAAPNRPGEVRTTKPAATYVQVVGAGTWGLFVLRWES